MRRNLQLLNTNGTEYVHAAPRSYIQIFIRPGATDLLTPIPTCKSEALKYLSLLKFTTYFLQLISEKNSHVRHIKRSINFFSPGITTFNLHAHFFFT